jgi:hypothetical protein
MTKEIPSTNVSMQKGGKAWFSRCSEAGRWELEIGHSLVINASHWSLSA